MSDSSDSNDAPSLTDQELDEAIHSFDTIQGELNYRQAQTALRGLVAGLDLTAQERQGLEPEITGLESMLDKLDRQIVHIAAFGMVGRGKSSLLNALLGETVFETGAIHGVTHRRGNGQLRSPSGQLVNRINSAVRSFVSLSEHCQWIICLALPEPTAAASNWQVWVR